MATFVQAVGSARTSGTSVNFTPGTPTTAGNLLVAIIGTANNQDVTSLTGGGNTWIEATPDIDYAWWHGEIWYCANALATSTAITANIGSSVDIRLVVLEYSGMGACTVRTTGVRNQSAEVTNWDPVSTSGSATAGDLVVASAITSGSSTLTADRGTSRYTDGDSDNPSITVVDVLSAAGGVETFDWTSSVADSGAENIVVFAPAGGGTTTRRYSLTTLGVG
jgi:hypothetical protein